MAVKTIIIDMRLYISIPKVIWLQKVIIRIENNYDKPYSSIFLYKVVRPIFNNLAVSVLLPFV